MPARHSRGGRPVCRPGSVREMSQALDRPLRVLAPGVMCQHVAPGFRAQYSKNFFVGYLSDPLGKKLALFCTATEFEI